MHMLNPNELRSAKISAVIGGHPVCRRPSAARIKATDDLATTNLQCGVRYVEWCDMPRARTIAFLLAHDVWTGPTYAARAGSYPLNLVRLAECRSTPEHEVPTSAQNVYETLRDK